MRSAARLIACFLICAAPFMNLTVTSGFVVDWRGVDEDAEDKDRLLMKTNFLKSRWGEMAPVVSRLRMNLDMRDNGGRSIFDRTLLHRKRSADCWDIADICCIWDVC